MKISDCHCPRWVASENPLAVAPGRVIMVADTAPADLRGTAYGFFNLMSGLALLVASALAGLLWDQWGASFTFVAGIVFSLAALALLCLRPTAK